MATKTKAKRITAPKSTRNDMIGSLALSREALEANFLWQENKSKDDLNALKIDVAVIKKEIRTLDRKIDENTDRLEGSIKEVKTDIREIRTDIKTGTRWMIRFGIAVMIGITGIILSTAGIIITLYLKS